MNEETSKPRWPALVIDPDSDVESYTEDDWFSDADLCDAATWGKSAQLVDSFGMLFNIKHTTVETKKILGFIPIPTVTNLLISTEKKIEPEKLVEKVIEIMGGNKKQRMLTDEYSNFVATVDKEEVIEKTIEYFKNI